MSGNANAKPPPSVCDTHIESKLHHLNQIHTALTLKPFIHERKIIIDRNNEKENHISRHVRVRVTPTSALVLYVRCPGCMKNSQEKPEEATKTIIFSLVVQESAWQPLKHTEPCIVGNHRQRVETLTSRDSRRATRSRVHVHIPGTHMNKYGFIFLHDILF